MNIQDIKDFIGTIDLNALNELQGAIQERKNKLESKQKQLVLYTHNCFDASNYHINKYKHWSKLITSVNTTKTNGYAFSGDFLSVTKEHKLPVDSIIVEVCSGDIYAYKLTSEGKQEILKGNTKIMSGFIEKVDKIVKGEVIE